MRGGRWDEGKGKKTQGSTEKPRKSGGEDARGDGLKHDLMMIVHMYPMEHTFGRHTLADFNVRLLDNHATLQRRSTGSAVLCRYHPALICFCKAFNRNNAFSGLVVAAITGTESNSPTSLQRWSVTLRIITCDGS